MLIRPSKVKKKLLLKYIFVKDAAFFYIFETSGQTFQCSVSFQKSHLKSPHLQFSTKHSFGRAAESVVWVSALV